MPPQLEITIDEIPRRVSEYVLRYVDLEDQPVKDGERYLYAKCPICSIGGYALVSKVRDVFRAYNPNKDGFEIIGCKCNEQNLSGPRVPPPTEGIKQDASALYHLLYQYWPEHLKIGYKYRKQKEEKEKRD